MPTRRQLIAATLLAAPAYALLGEAARARPAAGRGVAAWIGQQDELARGLAGGTLSQIAWHDGVNALAQEVDVAELAAAIRAAELRPAGDPFGHDPVKRFVHFRDEAGALRKFAYGAAIFEFGADSVITPHAHQHMASAHMVIAGKIRIRTFDRVDEEGGAILIRPTRDDVAEAGAAAAMTTAKDNVHWFAARSPRAMTFDVIVDGLDRSQPDYVIQPVDVLGGIARGDGVIAAKVMTFAELSQRYSADL